MATFSTEPFPTEEEEDPQTFLLVVNGAPILRSHTQYMKFGERAALYATLYDPQSVSQVAPCRLSDVQDHFFMLRCYLESSIAGWYLTASLNFITYGDSGPTLEIEYGIDIDEWAGPWSLAEYTRAIEETLVADPESGLVPDREFHERVGAWGLAADLSTDLRNEEATVGSVLGYWLPRAERIVRGARQTLADQLDRNTLVTLFDFPGHVSTACEQYLLYFVQFLRDLGIEADASIKHEARQVLFSVTPGDGAEALDRIREALDLYLRLPDSPEFAAQAPAYGDIAVQQLQANIYHLKGQLMVAGAVLQARDAQIEALQLSNFTYQQLLATQQQAATLPLLPPGSSGADAEPLVPGVIEVTKYEGKGFTVNLPELLRRLKRSFNQE